MLAGSRLRLSPTRAPAEPGMSAMAASAFDGTAAPPPAAVEGAAAGSMLAGGALASPQPAQSATTSSAIPVRVSAPAMEHDSTSCRFSRAGLYFVIRVTKSLDTNSKEEDDEP